MVKYVLIELLPYIIIYLFIAHPLVNILFEGLSSFKKVYLPSIYEWPFIIGFFASYIILRKKINEKVDRL